MAEGFNEHVLIGEVGSVTPTNACTKMVIKIYKDIKTGSEWKQTIHEIPVNFYGTQQNGMDRMEVGVPVKVHFHIETRNGVVGLIADRQPRRFYPTERKKPQQAPAPQPAHAHQGGGQDLSYNEDDVPPWP